MYFVRMYLSICFNVDNVSLAAIAVCVVATTRMCNFCALTYGCCCFDFYLIIE